MKLIPIRNHSFLMKTNRELFGYLDYDSEKKEFVPVKVSKEYESSVSIKSVITKLKDYSNPNIIFHTHPNTSTPCPSLEDYILSYSLIQEHYIGASVIVSDYGYAMITVKKTLLVTEFTKTIFKLIDALDKFDDWWTLKDHATLLKKCGLIIEYYLFDDKEYKYKYDKKYKTKILNELRDIYGFSMFKEIHD